MTNDLADGAALFTPVKVGRAGEDIALQIEAAIMDGEFKKGDRLPSERELQGLFHTGRGVIREALQALKQKGLIEVKKGAKGGTFVKNVDVSNAGESLALLLKQEDIHHDYLIEFRESVDRTITLLAVSRGTKAEKKSLLEKTSEFKTMLMEKEPDMEVIADMDRELNIMLAGMTQNPVFELIMRTMQLGFSSQDHYLYNHPEYRKTAGGNWYATALEIFKGEPLKAVSYISYHYNLLSRCLDDLKKEAKNPGDEEVRKKG